MKKQDWYTILFTNVKMNIHVCNGKTQRLKFQNIIHD